jgi:hypothetical protein
MSAWVVAANRGNDVGWMIKATVFDNSDGIRTTAFLGTFSPSVTRLRTEDCGSERGRYQRR